MVRLMKFAIVGAVASSFRLQLHDAAETLLTDDKVIGDGE